MSMGVTTVGEGSHTMTFMTRAWRLTSRVDVGGVGCPPQAAASPTWRFTYYIFNFHVMFKAIWGTELQVDF